MRGMSMVVNGHRAGAASAEDTYDIAIDIYSSPSLHGRSTVNTRRTSVGI